MMKSFLGKIGLIMILVFSGIFTQASDYPKSIQKKINKATKASFKSEDVVFESLNLEIDLADYPDIKDVKINPLKLDGNQVGYAGFASSKGKNDYFDYMVLFDNEMIIQKVVVLYYRSSYGGEIMARFWLKQFEGKSNGENMVFEKDIDTITGATISAPAITTGIKSLSLLMVHLKEAGKL